VPSRSGRSVAAAWLIALLVAAALLVATHFRTRDPDSRVYITIASQLAHRPIGTWIAPQWWGAWGLQGLFKEHPIGTFVVPALLARAGYPAAQSSFVVTLAAQIGCLLLLVSLARGLLPDADADALAWTLQLIPIAFVFRIRANQEYLLLVGLLLAVYGVERSRERWPWLGLALTGYVYALLVKGVFALLAPVIAALWLAVTKPSGPSNRTTNVVVPWLGVVMMLAVTPLIAWQYERLYVSVAGESFLAYYLGPRVTLEGGAPAGSFEWLLNKVWNVGWYGLRVLWYAAPWSLLLVTPFAWRSTNREPRARAWFRFTVGAALLTVILVGLRDTKADRYVFPAFFFATAAGSLAATGTTWGRRWRDRVVGYGPFGPIGLWLALFLARLVLG
jgi:hypothetical protein